MAFLFFWMRYYFRWNKMLKCCCWSRSDLSSLEAVVKPGFWEQSSNINNISSNNHMLAVRWVAEIVVVIIIIIAEVVIVVVIVVVMVVLMLIFFKQFFFLKLTAHFCKIWGFASLTEMSACQTTGRGDRQLV